MKKGTYHFLISTDGITAIEYALIALIVATAVVVGATHTGLTLRHIFTEIRKVISEVLDI